MEIAAAIIACLIIIFILCVGIVKIAKDIDTHRHNH